MESITRIFTGPVRKPRNKVAPENTEDTEPPERYTYESDAPKSLDKKVGNVLSKLGGVTKRVDYVLVYKKSGVTEKNLTKMETFLYNLEHKGFELESETYSLNNEVNFIKIHAPTNVLLYFADTFGIELTFRNIGYTIKMSSKPYKWMSTQLTDPDILDPVYQRARETFSGAPPKSITNAEKSLIIYKVLSKNPFGSGKFEYGIKKLIKSNVFECAYPLHDGTNVWTESGPLNDRQLLAMYWGNLKCWYKQQPLDLIERYYGPETAFYFAWLGFYIKMLIPASIIGFTFFFIGVVTFYDAFAFRTEEICESNILMCPRCIVKNCKYEPLHNSCFYAKLQFLFDNPFIITFAALMSVWSTVFLELWRREEAMLQIRWNLRSIEQDYSMRPEFEEKATHRKLSRITGKIEPYMGKRVMCYRYAITSGIVILLVILVTLGLIGIMVYVKTVSVLMTQNSSKEPSFIVGFVATFTGSMMSLSFIVLFDMVYRQIAFWLTNLENPRTQIDFDNSFTYKAYAITFINYYCVIFYIAFAKTRFYTYPGDKSLWTDLGGLRSDLCEPTGCIIQLGIQLIIMLFGKNLVLTARQYIVPRSMIIFKKFRKTKTTKNVFQEAENVKQWEDDYFLNEVAQNQIMEEYMWMVIQYGFVTFFVAAFPPAPLFALLNNVIELRVDASKFTSTFRRPVAFKISSLGAWNGILRGVTYIGVATNAFVIAFTSEFVQRVVYRHRYRYDLRGFINSTLSIYNVSEYEMSFSSKKNITVCYYPGKRYPPDHPNRYELTDDHWFDLAMKFLGVVIFEHVVVLVTGMVAHLIPDIPFSVKEHINIQKNRIKELKLKALREKYLKGRESDEIVFEDVELD